MSNFKFLSLFILICAIGKAKASNPLATGSCAQAFTNSNNKAEIPLYCDIILKKQQISVNQTLEDFFKLELLARYIQIRAPKLKHEDLLTRLLDKHERLGRGFFETITKHLARVSSQLSTPERSFIDELAKDKTDHAKVRQSLRDFIERTKLISHFEEAEIDVALNGFFNHALIERRMETIVDHEALLAYGMPGLELVSNSASRFYNQAVDDLNRCYDRCAGQAGIRGTFDLATAPLRGAKAATRSLKIGKMLVTGIIGQSREYALNQISKDMEKEEAIGNSAARIMEDQLKGHGSGIGVLNILGDLLGAVNNVSESAFCSLDCEQSYELLIHEQYLKISEGQDNQASNASQDVLGNRVERQNEQDEEKQDEAEKDQEEKEEKEDVKDSQDENESDDNGVDIDHSDYTLDSMIERDAELISDDVYDSDNYQQRYVRVRNDGADIDDDAKNLKAYLAILKRIPKGMRGFLLNEIIIQYWELLFPRNTFCDDKICQPTDFGANEENESDSDGTNDRCVDKKCLEQREFGEESNPNPMDAQDLFCMDKICLPSSPGRGGFFDRPDIPQIPWGALPK